LLGLSLSFPPSLTPHYQPSDDTFCASSCSPQINISGFRCVLTN
jgi:hypothetical protein